MLKVKGALGLVAVVGVEAALASSAVRRVRVSSWVARKSWDGFVMISRGGWWERGLVGSELCGEGIVDS